MVVVVVVVEVGFVRAFGSGGWVMVGCEQGWIQNLELEVRLCCWLCALCNDFDFRLCCLVAKVFFFW